MNLKRIVLTGIGSLLLIASSCSKSKDVAASTAPAHMKTCFQCQGTSAISCAAPGCKNGQVECPGRCLKLSKGSWVHMTVAGHGPNELWQEFPMADGSSQSWNQNHVGEVIEMRNGNAVNAGKCPTCSGATRVKCPACKGTGHGVCTLCEGKKFVPETWTAFDHPRMKNRPSRFKLKDGRTIVGRRSMTLGSRITLRTETGAVEVDVKDIVSEEKAAAP